MIAMEADVQTVSNYMNELEKLEDMLDNETKSSGDEKTPSGKSIEIKAAIKKLMTSTELSETLNRLEIHGEPVWGLSSTERELIETAREKVNAC